MPCNILFREVCEIYTDSYGSCADHDVCLAQLIGEEAMLEKCRNCGLDKTYPEIYKEIEVKLSAK